MNPIEMKFNSWQEAASAANAVVREGDLIFLDVPTFLFRRVARSTKSWTSHVGIVFRDSGGRWMVGESTIPLSRTVTLESYLRGSSRFNFEIRRLNRTLSVAEMEALKVNSRALMGRFYGLRFNFDSTLLFCSKFVYLTYRSIGVEVGKIETFRDLLSENPGASLKFWKIWFFGSIPWDQRTVTPASQLKDPQFHTVLKGVDHEVRFDRASHL